MAKSEEKPPITDQAILKMRAFVEKMGSVEKAKAALQTLDKVRKAA